jgi:hypothetical protein
MVGASSGNTTARINANWRAAFMLPSTLHQNGMTSQSQDHFGCGHLRTDSRRSHRTTGRCNKMFFREPPKFAAFVQTFRTLVKCPPEGVPGNSLVDAKSLERLFTDPSLPDHLRYWNSYASLLQHADHLLNSTSSLPHPKPSSSSGQIWSKTITSIGSKISGPISVELFR